MVPEIDETQLCFLRSFVEFPRATPEEPREIPAGVLKVKNFDKSFVATTQTVEDSCSQFAEGQAEGTKRALSTRFNSEASASATIEVTKRAALTPLPKEEAEQEDAPGKKRKTGKSGTEEEENEAGDGYNFCDWAFPHEDNTATTESAITGTRRKAQGKGKAKASPKGGRIRKMGKTSPLQRKEKTAKVPAAPKLPSSKIASQSSQPEWRVRHNKQRRMQQIEQHLLNGKQHTETFNTTPSKVVVKAVVGWCKALAEALEADNSFMLHMQGESGGLTEEGILKVHVVFAIDIASDVFSCTVCVYLFV